MSTISTDTAGLPGEDRGIRRSGAAALIIGHCAGLIDLVALPVWVGALITHFRFSPSQAGGLVTLFLIGAVLASVLTARNFNRVNRKLLATLGFAVAAAAFGPALAFSPGCICWRVWPMASRSASCMARSGGRRTRTGCLPWRASGWGFSA